MKKVNCIICGCKHEGRGYCKKHYRSFLRYGDPLYVEKKRAERAALMESRPKPTRFSREGTCSVEGCHSPIKSKQLCEKHYARQRRTGNLDIQSIEQGSITTCLAVGCSQPHKTNGYCTTHYMNFRRTGSPHLPEVVKYCGVKGCRQIHLGRGLCRFHYYQWEKNLKAHNLSKQLEE